MLDHIKLENALVFDVETVPGVAGFDILPDEMKELWEKKSSRFIREDETLADNYFDCAGIYAEFGKAVCISAGFFVKDDSCDKLNFRVRSFAAKNEAQLLLSFKQLLDSYYCDDKHFLCGHNIKEFDIPYLCRRMLVNGIPLPRILDIFGKKPWEVLHVDTMQLCNCVA